MINLVSNTISDKEIDLLCDWLKTKPRLTKGKLNDKAQIKWAEAVGTKYSVFVNSGSSAILLTLSALLQGNYLRNNRIVVPALSWSTDLSSPMLLGMDVSLVDCNLTDLSPDLDELEKVFIKNDPSCMILVSVLGIPPNYTKILRLCKKYNVILLEDNCESAGSRFNSKNLGTFGLASFYSFYFGHHLSCIEGGFINTSDKKLYDILVCIRNHGWSRDLDDESKNSLRKENNDLNIDGFNELYTFYYKGFNCRSTDLQAFLALNQIKKLEKVSNKRYSNYLDYLGLIRTNLLSLPKKHFVSNFAFPVVSKKRESIVKALSEYNIESRPLISGSMGRQPFWVKEKGIHKFKNADLIHEYGFYVPNNADIKSKDILLISNIINSF